MELNFYRRGEKLSRYFINRYKRELQKRSLLIILLISFLCIFIKNFIIFPVKIKSEAMAPSLNNNHYAFFSRLKIGIKIPFFENKKYNMIYRFKHPGRGDIVAFTSPKKKAANFFMQVFDLPISVLSFGLLYTDRHSYYVRRVLAVEGEKVEIINKQIYLNNKRFVPDWQIYFSDRRILHKDISVRDNMPSVIVPEKEVFVISDNWDYAQDSRFFETIPIERIHGIQVGKITFNKNK